MSLLQRIGASKIPYNLEIHIHHLSANLKNTKFVKFLVERSRKKRQETQRIPYSKENMIFEYPVGFETNMFKKGDKFVHKYLKFTLYQSSGSSFAKNGSAKVEYSVIAKTGVAMMRQKLKLKDCTDRQAYVCVSINCLPKDFDNYVNNTYRKRNNTVQSSRNASHYGVSPIKTFVGTRDFNIDDEKPKEEHKKSPDLRRTFSHVYRNKEINKQLEELLSEINSESGDLPHSNSSNSFSFPSDEPKKQLPSKEPPKSPPNESKEHLKEPKDLPKEPPKEPQKGLTKEPPTKPPKEPKEHSKREEISLEVIPNQELPPETPKEPTRLRSSTTQEKLSENLAPKSRLPSNSFINLSSSKIIKPTKKEDDSSEEEEPLEVIKKQEPLTSIPESMRETPEFPNKPPKKARKPPRTSDSVCSGCELF